LVDTNASYQFQIQQPLVKGCVLLLQFHQLIYTLLTTDILAGMPHSNMCPKSQKLPTQRIVRFFYRASIPAATPSRDAAMRRPPAFAELAALLNGLVGGGVERLVLLGPFKEVAVALVEWAAAPVVAFTVCVVWAPPDDLSTSKHSCSPSAASMQVVPAGQYRPVVQHSAAVIGAHCQT
jgi:hypothetical protein